MADRNVYPKYNRAEDASCFNCSRPLAPSTVRKSGHSEGSGAMMGFCPACSMFTWFDLKPLHRTGRAYDKRNPFWERI